ncbi:subtilisin-like protein [Trichoderma longibrachiatum]|uniref:Subtilisin-like protein n=1 Tax=Trichoderma longibrachiatum ATCC 18648 TaxID=983965 RepID=A0A2T4BPS8_TRILO|nr:subtilisin-like protein [Trichoderma longibrachiatum ATCC 18648]
MPQTPDRDIQEVVYEVCLVAGAFRDGLRPASQRTYRIRCLDELSESELQDLGIELHRISLHEGISLPLLTSSADLTRCFSDIAQCMNDMLEELYITRLANRFLSVAANRGAALWKLAQLITWSPREISIESAIRQDIGEICFTLLPLLQIWEQLINQLMPSSKRLPGRQIETSALRNAASIRTSTGKLHRTLHEHWPCRLNVQAHRGSLCDCLMADLQLEPHWLMSGNDEESFFLLLKGSGISQECKIHLSEPSMDSLTNDMEDKQTTCLTRHEDWQDYCLYLSLEKSGQLLAWPSRSFDVQLQWHNNLCDTVEFRLVTLETLLQCLSPKYDARTCVELVLARSLLLLLHGPWVESHLHLQNVSVFCKIENGVVMPELDKLFLSTRFGSAIDPRPLHNSWSPLTLRAIEAFAILLAEIELGDKVMKIYESLEPDLKAKRPTKVAKALLHECEKRLPCGRGVVQVIKSCLNRELFGCSSWQSPDGPIQNDQAFIECYYSNVIAPLEQELVEGLEWSWDEVKGRAPSRLGDTHVADVIKPLEACQSGKAASTPAPTVLAAAGHTTHTDNDPAERETPKGSDSDGWFEELKKAHFKRYRRRKDDFDEESPRHIKVAVIDTGVDLTHEAFEGLQESGQLIIQEGSNIVDPGQPMTDSDGHGTHCCELILRTAPFAQVYPLKVSSARTGVSPQLVAKAICYAIKEGVDIISMSLVFDREEKAVKGALGEVMTKLGERADAPKPVLLFAAASNNRALDLNRIGYPAREWEKVICVNCSTKYDEKSNFSPHGETGAANLSAIGENIKVACPNSRGGSWKRISGTSFSTPIVAGVAAMLLDFAMQDLTGFSDLEEWNDKKAELWELIGMRSVLKRCMTSAYEDGRYNLVKPWELLSKSEGQIAHAILEALASKHRWGR